MAILERTKYLKGMRVAGKMAADTLDYLEQYVKAGVTTEQIDAIAHKYIVDVLKAYPAPLHYKGFPKSICTSVNHVAVHGIPKKRKLNPGDIINIDVTVKYDGYHGDTSRMYTIGKVSALASDLIKVTNECLEIGIDVVKANAKVADIANAVNSHAKANGYSVVKEFCGHGIGTEFHTAPWIIHHEMLTTGECMMGEQRLQKGSFFTIEPILSTGSPDILVLKDGWTAVTKDKSLTAQAEHTIAILGNGKVEVLTRSSNG